MSDHAEAAEEKPAKSKMPFIVLGVGVACLAGGGAMAFMGKAGAKEKPAAKHAAADGEEHGEHGEEEEAEEEEDHGGGGGGHGGAASPNVKLDPFIANLVTQDGDMHYVKCTIVAEAANEKGIADLDKKMPRVRQDVLLYLASLSVADTMGVENRKKIQAAVEGAVRQAAGKKVVKRVFITEFVIQ